MNARHMLGESDHQPADGPKSAEAAVDALKELIRAGAALANCAYNLAEMPSIAITNQRCETLNACRREWDNAIDALRQRQQEQGAEAAINRVAGELPDGAQLSICVERGAGWVDAFDWDGNPWEADTADMTLAEQVLEALQWCKDAEAAAPQPPAVKP